ncbi:hypothetical protein CA3LBN_000311 [Candidozyma haemuli]|uniref:C2H2-type domain-containing protein n=1 Tax=Candidozyma haemuli TaxID=45357 RepID=A0ABX8I0Z2_9ASCO|nr:hypothetical protein CA3LBN_000311 [[Candida] haemuloni]
MSPRFERSILLDEDPDESTISPFLNQSHVTDRNMNDEISKLKTDSTKRFKERWEKILEKYSAIDDDLESDEIDLESGKITIDNGHLRSMAPNEIIVGGVKVNGDIWADDDSYDKAYSDQKRVQAHQERLRKRFESHIRRHKEGSPLKRNDVPSDNLHNTFLSPTKRCKPESPLYRDSTACSSLSDDSDASELYASPFRSSRMGSVPSSPLKPSSSISPTKRLRKSHPPYWYNCAFEYCSFITEEKFGYESHLLAKHADELSFIGYPVKGNEGRITSVITELCTRKLALHFPLSFDSEGQALDKDTGACPLLGCDFSDNSIDRLIGHIKKNHKSIVARTGFPTSASRSARHPGEIMKEKRCSPSKLPIDNHEEKDRCLYENSSANPSSLDIPSAPPFQIMENALSDPEEKDDKYDGYDSIDEFFND